MDNQNPQSGGHSKIGHEEDTISIKGIVYSGLFLFLGGVIAFVSMYFFYGGLEKWRKDHEAKMTPMEQQLLDQREMPKDTKTEPAGEEAANSPEVYGQRRDRKAMEAHLKQTFPGPRLQYDDEHDMKLFRSSEDEWLTSTGKDANGNIHIPVDKAIDLISQRGLPAVSGPWQPPTLPTAVPMVPAQTAKK
jgi:hypothetical protein